MTKLVLLYISLSGNTSSFLKLLEKELTSFDVELINVKDLAKNGASCRDLSKENVFVFLPTYLEGGNGIDNGDVEILTTPLRQTIRSFADKSCIKGIYGFGNKNFNKQYCLTAKQYSSEFRAPVLGEIELRGSEQIAKEVASQINEIISSANATDSINLISQNTIANLNESLERYKLANASHIKIREYAALSSSSKHVKSLIKELQLIDEAIDSKLDAVKRRL